MSDPQLAIRRLAQAIEILACRLVLTIGTIDAEEAIALCGEALEAMNDLAARGEAS